MSLILDPAAHPPERLRAMLVEQREGIEEIRSLVASTPRELVRDPASFRTIDELLADTATLLRQVESSESDPASVAAAVNLGYSAMLAAIDLRKSHASVPKVPKGPANPAPP